MLIRAIGFLVICISVCGPVSAATYTTTQDGNWNTDATWGGGGHPTSNDDVAVIGHDVTYDAGESSIVWGNVTINSGGMLVFPSNASSIMSFSGTAVLTVNNGGELRTGSTSAVADVGAAYTLVIQWANGATARNVFVVAVGGSVDIRGDADYYGGTRYAYLDSDWTTGSTLYLQGDMTGKWASGHVFYIFDNADTYASNGYQTQGDTYTISSVGSYDSGNDRTPIVVTAANPTRTCYAVNNSDWRSKLCMVSRNVILRDTGQTSYAVYGYNSYTERIQISPGAQTSETVRFTGCLFQGMNYILNGGEQTVLSSCSAINTHIGFHQVSMDTIDIDAVSMAYLQANGTSYGTAYSGYFGSISTVFDAAISPLITGEIINCHNCMLAGTTRANVYSNFICNNVVSNATPGSKMTGNFFNNYIVANVSNDITVSGVFKNNTKLGVRATGRMQGDFSSFSFDDQAYASHANGLVLEDSTLIGADRFPYRVYGNAGTLLPLDSGDTDWQIPDSGGTWILKAAPNSYCIFTAPHQQIEYSPSNAMATYAPASSTTLTFKIWPVGWTTSLDQDDVVLEVKYLDTASGITRTTAYNTAQTYANGAWRNCSVTFTPAQAGIVYFNLYFRSYESGAYVLIDPIWGLD